MPLVLWKDMWHVKSLATPEDSPQLILWNPAKLMVFMNISCYKKPSIIVYGLKVSI